jgi:two-component system chemotaxis response regulator CheY
MNYASHHVLVVDDHAFTRVLIKEVLQNMGFNPNNIQEAEDGEAGLRIVAEGRIDLIFCDWQMQPMDGLSFMRELRDPKKNKNPELPVIFCSAYTERELIEHARDSGVTEIMTKPITAKAIEARVESVLKNPRAFVKADAYFGPDQRRRNLIDEDFPEDRRKARTGSPSRP